MGGPGAGRQTPGLLFLSGSEQAREPLPGHPSVLATEFLPLCSSRSQGSSGVVQEGGHLGRPPHPLRGRDLRVPPWFCAVACPFREGTTPGSIPALTAFITIIIKGFAEAGMAPVSCRGWQESPSQGLWPLGATLMTTQDFTRRFLPRGVGVRALRRSQGFNSTEGTQTSPNPLSHALSDCPSDPLPSDAPYSLYQEKDTRDSETPLTVWKSGSPEASRVQLKWASS